MSTNRAQPQSPRDVASARAVLLAIPLAMCVLTVVEAALVPARVYAAVPLRALGVPMLALGSMPVLFAGPLAFQVVLGAALTLAPAARAPRWLYPLLALAGAAGLVGWGTLMLAGDRALLLYVPLQLSQLAFFAYGVAFVVACVPEAVSGFLRARMRLLRGLLLALAALVACAGYVAHRLVVPEDYAHLHLSALSTVYATLHAAFALALLLTGATGTPSRLLRGGALTTGVFALAAFAVSCTAWGDLARPHFRAHTSLGRASVAWLPFADRGAQVRGSRPRLDDALGHFAAHSGLPRLPDAFHVEAHNVLLIVVEATRYDLSLGDRMRDPMPKLRAWAERRTAFSFRRAFSPSSGTGQSLASLFTMTYPSAVYWELWPKRWDGRLLDRNETVAELLSAAGHDTFWIGHNYRGIFDHGLLGLEQGFRTRVLFPSPENTGTVDRQIADRALAEVRARAADGRRFFGFVFLVAPHRDNVVHDPTLPSVTEVDRYRQELRFVDGQIARVLDGLDAVGLGERTVVIVTGDHGEQFYEHGGLDHTRNVYAESAWVPLLVKVPGIEGGPRDEPTSATYVFPWLLSRGTPAMRAAVDARITREVGPMMVATSDAVLVELLGRDKMMTALVHRDTKLNYDFVSGLRELFAARADPLDQHDLHDTRPDLAARAEGWLGGYREVRAATENLVVAPSR